MIAKIYTEPGMGAGTSTGGEPLVPAGLIGNPGAGGLNKESGYWWA